MQKDVIYIDTEDDITAIIGKVRASDQKIVALVPPKRIGAIQSAVNLKLVHRAAEQAGKRLVLISSNAALIALAASASIPVARNLQSKPELAEIPALEVDDGDDVIDGNAVAAPAAAAEGETAAALEGVERTAAPVTPSAPKTALGATALAAGSKVKIPNFDKFRKKLFFIIAAVVLLIGFIVWAVVYAPSAKITITARTSDSSLNTQVKLGDNLATSLRDGTLKSLTKTTKKDVSVPFNATGSKNVGDKATGTIKFSTSSPDGASIPAGTAFTVSGLSFTLDSAVTVPGATLSFGCGGICPGTASGSITAAEGGTKYNGAKGSANGAPSGVSASVPSATSGGTDKTATVVQQSDVDSVSDSIVSSSDSDTAKKSLTDQFGKDYVVISGSFKSDTSGVKPNPAVGAEADSGKGALAGSVTFSLTAVSKKDLGSFLDDYFAQQIDGQNNQKVYDNGVNDVSFTNVDATDGGYSANMTTNGKIGPKIDEKSLKEYARGKRLGEIQSYVQNINGVDGVDIKFSPFWVTSAPNNVNKIHVEFKVND